MELEDDQIPQEAYVSRNDSVSGNTSRTIVSSEKNVIDKVTLVPSPSVSPIVGFQYLGIYSYFTKLFCRDFNVN